MSFFGLGNGQDRYGVIIDIGSGSVLTAIVHSKEGTKHPQIVWSYREHAPLRNIDSLEKSAKAVITALFNAAMLVDAEGRKTLYEYSKSAKIGHIQFSVSAPWSYTVSKNINFAKDEPFEITKDLIEELTKAINDKIENELGEDEKLMQAGLKIISRSHLNIVTNGYHVAHPEGNQTTNINISHSTAICQQQLVDAMDEMHDKMFVSAEDKKTSFMLMMYIVSRQLMPKNQDLCLIDVTDEATEVGVVRDGLLNYCTHTPFGIFSLAREISAITNLPLHESLGYLRSETPYAFIKTLNTTKAAEIEAVFESYIDKVSSVFRETGDNLAIPRNIAIHTDLTSETLLSSLISKAAKRATRAEPAIKSISQKIISEFYMDNEGKVETLPNDTALLLSAWFFHNQARHKSLDYF